MFSPDNKFNFSLNKLTQTVKKDSSAIKKGLLIPVRQQRRGTNQQIGVLARKTDAKMNVNYNDPTTHSKNLNRETNLPKKTAIVAKKEVLNARDRGNWQKV